MLKKVLLVILLVLIVASNVAAQEGLIDLHSKVFESSVVGTYYNPDATRDCYNPANMSELEDHQQKAVVVFGVGKTQFPSGNINYCCSGGFGKVSKNVFLGFYKYSTAGNVNFVQGPLAGANINYKIPANEFLLEYKINNNWSTGVGIVTGENGDMMLSANGIKLASSDMKTNYNYRMGLLYKTTNRKLKFGVVHNEIKNSFNQTLNPALTGLSTPIQVSDNVRSSHTTLGIQYNLNPASSLFYNHRFSKYQCDGTTKRINYPYYGVKKFMTKNIQLCFAYADKYPEFGLNYYTKDGWNGSFNYRKGEALEGFGNNDTYFWSLSKSF